VKGAPGEQPARVTAPARARVAFGWESGQIAAMRTFAELESLWRSIVPVPRGAGTVKLLCVRKGSGAHDCPERARITRAEGVEGDRWLQSSRRNPARQVTLIDARVADLVAAGAVPLHQAGDNFLVDLDLSAAALPVGARLRLGSAVVEITAEPHSGCGKFSARFGAEALAWVNFEGHRERRLRGVNCRVVVDGEVAVGDSVGLEPEPVSP
jgi:MOSC domain-containing protein YiiM